MGEDWSRGEDDDVSRRITAVGRRTERRGKSRKAGMAACDNAGFMLKGVSGGFKSSPSPVSLSVSPRPLTQTQGV